MIRALRYILAGGAALAALGGLVLGVAGGAYAIGRGLSVGAAILAGFLVAIPIASIAFMLLLWAGSLRKRLGTKPGGGDRQ